MAQIIAHLTLDTYEKNKITPLIVPQGDYGSREIVATITTQGKRKSVDSAAAVFIVARRTADNASKAFQGTVNEDGSVTVPVTQWMLEYPDDVICHVSVTGNEYQYSTNEFLIEAQEKDTPNDISEDDPRVDFVAEVLANENARQEAEERRKQNEVTRENNEIERIDSETGRLAAEALRIENENQRVLAEESRDSTFQSWSNEISLLPDMSSRISRNSKRIERLEKRINPSPFLTDDSIAYQKNVPENALLYAEISKIGGMSYRDTATNTLKDVKVTEVKSIGVNMIPYPFAFSSNTVSGVTFKANSDGSIYVNGKATANASQFVKKLESLPKGTYCLSGTKGGVSIYLQLWNGGTWVKEIWVNGPFTVDYSNYNAIDVVVYVASGTSVNTTIYPMINPGSTALPFAPYKSDTRAIPSEVQALEGYGMGVDATYCNHISWSEDGSKKSYHKKVFKRVFDGTESGWSRTTTSSGASRFQYYNTTNKPIAADVTTASPLVCSHLPTKSANDTWFDQDGASMQGEMFYVKDSKYTTLDEWKAFLVEQNANGTPFTIVYAVATPTETDISNLITSDNMLEVEGGGIIVAENENKHGVPATITYQLKEESV